MREWIARVIDWLRRERLDRELAEELRFHRRQLELDAVARGDAHPRRVAARRLGNETIVREQAWERWSIPWLDQLQRDVRHSLRELRRAPAFTGTVVLTLGLGIGANAAMFNVVDRLMFRPLAHLRDPDSVHRIYWQWLDHGTEITATSSPYARYLDLERWTTSFSGFAAFSERNLAVGEGEAAQEQRVAAVSASYFAFFDARPVLGRYFADDEDVTPRGADVAVLSHAFWQSRFGGRNVVGEPLVVGDIAATIIGVAPPGFSGVNDANPPDVYVPITTYAASTGTDDARTYYSTYQWGWANILVRRKPGVTVEQAQADASRAFRRSWEVGAADEPSHPPIDAAQPRAAVSSVRPGAGPKPGLEARTALWVTIVAAIVLLIACANVANLLLSRALQRQQEMAVRLALGAGRRRLIVQSLTASLTVSLLGAGVALLVAQTAGAAIRRLLITTEMPVNVFTDGRTLVVTLALGIASGVVVGLVPAFTTGRFDLTRVLRSGVRGGMQQHARVRAGLLVLQSALSVALLTGAALFVRSLQAVRSMPMGYDASQVLLVNRVIRGPAFDDSLQQALRPILMAAAEALPEVESVAWMSSAPFISTSSTNLYVEGIDSVGVLGEFTYQATTPGYFRTMRTPMLRGRGLTGEDRLGGPGVAVVSESMARVLWPGRAGIGECFRMGADTAPCLTVVGIASDMVQRDISGGTRYHYYLSIDQYTRTWGNGMVLRVRGDPARHAESIRSALQRVMPGASYVTVRLLRDVVDDAQRSWRLGATMFVAFGILALVVSAVGLYGVIGYNVSVRLHELSVRVALGAGRSHILRMVVRQSVLLMMAGLSVGIVFTFAGHQWIEPLLFHQSALDPRVYGGVSALLVVVALVASALPAARAARADPNAALRTE